MKHCPTCGARVPEKKLAVDLVRNEVTFGKTARTINRRTAEFVHLLVQAQTEVGYDRLISRMWGVREPGAPLKTLQVYASLARKALRPLGFTVKSCYGHGYRIEAV